MNHWPSIGKEVKGGRGRRRGGGGGEEEGGGGGREEERGGGGGEEEGGGRREEEENELAIFKFLYRYMKQLLRIQLFLNTYQKSIPVK